MVYIVYFLPFFCGGYVAFSPGTVSVLDFEAIIDNQFFFYFVVPLIMVGFEWMRRA